MGFVSLVSYTGRSVCQPFFSITVVHKLYPLNYLALAVPFLCLAAQASLGLRQPYGCSSQAAIAEWEASLKRSTVSLRAFRKALGEAGLVLGRARVRGDRGHGINPALSLRKGFRFLTDYTVYPYVLVCFVLPRF